MPRRALLFLQQARDPCVGPGVRRVFLTAPVALRFPRVR